MHEILKGHHRESSKPEARQDDYDAEGIPDQILIDYGVHIINSVQTYFSQPFNTSDFIKESDAKDYEEVDRVNLTHTDHTQSFNVEVSINEFEDIEFADQCLVDYDEADLDNSTPALNKILNQSDGVPESASAPLNNTEKTSTEFDNMESKVKVAGEDIRQPLFMSYDQNIEESLAPEVCRGVESEKKQSSTPFGKTESDFFSIQALKKKIYKDFHAQDISSVVHCCERNFKETSLHEQSLPVDKTQRVKCQRRLRFKEATADVHANNFHLSNLSNNVEAGSDHPVMVEGIKLPGGNFHSAPNNRAPANLSYPLQANYVVNVQGISSHLWTNCNTHSGNFSSSADDKGHESKAISVRIPTCETYYGGQPLSALKAAKHDRAPYEIINHDTDQPVDTEENTNLSPKWKKRKTSTINGGDQPKHCNCKKSKCSKLYCECLRAGLYCGEFCTCLECENTSKHEDHVLRSRSEIKAQDPDAFSPKVIEDGNELPTNNMMDARQLTPSLGRCKTGCSCKRSYCNKKYCECYQGKVGCTTECRCEGCQNSYGKRGESVTQEKASDGANVLRLEDSLREDRNNANLLDVADQNVDFHHRQMNYNITGITGDLSSHHNAGENSFPFPSSPSIPSSFMPSSTPSMARVPMTVSQNRPYSGNETLYPQFSPAMTPSPQSNQAFESLSQPIFRGHFVNQSTPSTARVPMTINHNWPYSGNETVHQQFSPAMTPSPQSNEAFSSLSQSIEGRGHFVNQSTPPTARVPMTINHNRPYSGNETLYQQFSPAMTPSPQSNQAFTSLSQPIEGRGHFVNLSMPSAKVPMTIHHNRPYSGNETLYQQCSPAMTPSPQSNQAFESLSQPIEGRGHFVNLSTPSARVPMTINHNRPYSGNGTPYQHISPAMTPIPHSNKAFESLLQPIDFRGHLVNQSTPSTARVPMTINHNRPYSGYKSLYQQFSPAMTPSPQSDESFTSISQPIDGRGLSGNPFSARIPMIVNHNQPYSGNETLYQYSSPNMTPFPSSDEASNSLSEPIDGRGVFVNLNSPNTNQIPAPRANQNVVVSNPFDSLLSPGTY